MTGPKVKLVKIEADSYQIDYYDKKRKSQAYAVLLDGEKIGEVRNRSIASHRKARGRLRGSWYGFSLYWTAIDNRVWIDRYCKTRADAVAAVIKHYEESK